jgi:hypothetical protein
MEARVVYLQRPEHLPTFSYRTFGCEIYDVRLSTRTIALLLIALHLLTIDKSIPKRRTIIETDRGGKGRKRSGFFNLTLTTTNTSARSRWNSIICYDKHPLAVFRGHIHQEDRCHKFVNYHKSKKNKKSS